MDGLSPDPAARANVSPAADPWAPPSVKLQLPAGHAVPLQANDSIVLIPARAEDALVIEERQPRAIGGSASTICWSPSQTVGDRKVQLSSIGKVPLIDLLPYVSLFELTNQTVVCQIWFEFYNSLGSTRKVGPHVLRLQKGLPTSLRFLKLDQNPNEGDIRQIPLEKAHEIRVRSSIASKSPVLAHLICEQFTTHQEFPSPDVVDIPALLLPVYAKVEMKNARLIDLYPNQRCLLTLTLPQGQTLTSASFYLTTNLPPIKIQFEQLENPVVSSAPSMSLMRISLHNPNPFPVDVEISVASRPMVKVQSVIYHRTDSGSCELDGVSTISQAPIQFQIADAPVPLSLEPMSFTIEAGVTQSVEGYTQLNQTHCLGGVQLFSNDPLKVDGYITEVENLPSFVVRQYPIQRALRSEGSTLEPQTIYTAPSLTPAYIPVGSLRGSGCKISREGALKLRERRPPLSCR